MKFRLVEKANPLDRSKKKWYANPVNTGKIGAKGNVEAAGRKILPYDW